MSAAVIMAQSSRIGAIPYRFALGVHCETSRGQHNTLVSFADQSAPEVSDHACANRALITLALK
jgi:hypothetical protein